MKQKNKDKIVQHNIKIFDNVSVQLSENKLLFNGVKGSLLVEVKNNVQVSIENNHIFLEAKGKDCSKYVGLYKALINNAMIGVSQGFEKKLELVGVGYRASLQNNNLVLNVGYSHPVIFEKIDGIDFEVKDNNIITVRGIDKVKVGDVAAKIRSVRKPDRYKGKGIRYLGEVVLIKKTKGKK